MSWKEARVLLKEEIDQSGDGNLVGWDIGGA